MYRLKEKLRIRDAGSALPDLADTTFLDNLNLIRMDPVAGLLFVGKAVYCTAAAAGGDLLHYSDEAQTEYDNRMDIDLDSG